MNTGCLILAGGKSRRMGYRKSSLRLNGTTFLDKLIFELRDFPEILVSVDDAARHPEIPYSMIDDRLRSYERTLQCLICLRVGCAARSSL